MLNDIDLTCQRVTQNDRSRNEATESAKESNSGLALRRPKMETFTPTHRCLPSLHHTAHSLRPWVRPYDEGKEATHETRFEKTVFVLRLVAQFGIETLLA